MIAYVPKPVILEALPLTGHAVIEASAGTGKTYTIEHLVVDRLLRTDCTLEEILVVTFTEKATSELRARIRALIEKVLSARPDAGTQPSGPHWAVDDRGRQALEGALFAFDRAPIYTIHGFCHRALFDMAFESGQLFEQTLAEPRRLFHRAFRETLRERLAVEPALKERLRAWLESGRDEAGLEWLLFGAHKVGYLQSQDALPGTLTEQLDVFEAQLDPSAILHDFSLCAIQASAQGGAQRTLDALARIFAEHQTPTARLRAIVNLDVSGLLKPRRTGSKKKRPFPEGLGEDTKLTLERLRRMKVVAALEASDERAIVDACLPVITERLNQIKAREGLLDFNDLLSRLWQAMERPEGAALTRALRERYRYGLIDEFQDTDTLQWQIFRRIFVERPEPVGGLYLIGDPKQAIYAFRGADVHTYLGARRALLDQGATKAPLSTNYRSTAAMITAVNTILDQRSAHPLMTGEILYDTPVECGNPGYRAADRYGEPAASVVLWRYDPPPPRSSRSRTIPPWQIERTLLNRLATSVRRLLEDPAGQVWVSEEGKGEGEPLKASEVFVLVRSKKEAQAVADALRVVGVPHCLYKQDGLFQTREARDTLELLRAIADPADRSARLRALATAYFGAAWSDLPQYRNLPGHHPAVERLLEWRKIAESDRVATLFTRLLDDSGLVERELLFADSERELTNYQHILELLLEVTTQRRLSLPEVVEQLQQYIDRLDLPDGMDGNIQRLPSERDAVQIMTMHKSKGLEAGAVVLFGGYRASPQGAVAVIREGDHKRVLIGKTAQQTAAERVALEAEEENQRLLYVALTRAKVRLYLPFIDSSRGLEGSYRPLNERLRVLYAEGLPPGFEVVEAEHHELPPRAHTPASSQPLDAWKPPAELLKELVADPEAEAALYARHRPLIVTSYTRLKKTLDQTGLGAQSLIPLAPDEFKRDETGADGLFGTVSEAAETEAVELPGGRYMGRFLHEAIEALPFSSLDLPFEAWKSSREVLRAFEWAQRRHDIDARWLPRSLRLIYQTLKRPTALGADTPPVVLGACQKTLTEMEFLYPIPEAAHPLLQSGVAASPAPSAGPGSDSGARPWAVERGFVKGFVDYIFRHGERTYLCDWKSDILPSYSPAAVEAHVAGYYGLQAKLYTLGVCRWLGASDPELYEARFGGLLYVFLRGRDVGEAFEAVPDPASVAPDGEGVYFHRPPFEILVQWEQELMGLIEP